MNIFTKTLTVFTLAISAGAVNANALFTLENLERERASLINNLLSEEVDGYQREQQTQSIVRRLTDIERMVLRDDRIAASNSVMAKKAFENYDLTFMVHAGSESKKSMTAHWLTQLNITSQSIDQARVGAR